MRRSIVILAWLAVAAQAQSPADVAARAWRETHERPILLEFLDLLALPNIAPANLASARSAAEEVPGADIRKNAAAVSALLEKRGVKTRLLEVPGAPPVVFGEIQTPGANRTLIFY